MLMAQTEVDRLADAARETGRLGLDTEFMPEGRYRPLLCLVQLVVGEEVAVLDPLAGPLDAGPLAELLADPAIEVVLHAGRQDVAILRREGRATLPNRLHTHGGARVARLSPPAGDNPA